MDMRILELTNGDYYIHIRHNLNEIMFSAVFNWYFWLKVIHTFTFRSCISRENHVIRFHSTIFFYSWIHFFHFCLVDVAFKFTLKWKSKWHTPSHLCHTRCECEYVISICSGFWWTHSDNVTFSQTRRSVNKLAATESVQRLASMFSIRQWIESTNSKSSKIERQPERHNIIFP